MVKKLNIGCGNDYREGWINLDQPGTILKREPEIRFNLNKKRWDFEDETFDYVYCSHVLEHLEDPINSMNELTRILKPYGQLLLKVPHYSYGWTNPTHQRAFSSKFYELMVGEGYLKRGLCAESITFKWMTSQPFVTTGLVMRGIIKAVNLCANGNHLSQWFCERVWCYWVGGFEEMEFLFRKVVR